MAAIKKKTSSKNEQNSPKNKVKKNQKKDIKVEQPTSPLKQKNKIKTKPSKANVTEVAKIKKKHSFDPIRANRGVVYINHIPHGFYEEQLKKFFQQFGEVTRTRVARSETTGKSKGFAFVEFRVPEVAEIAAETMDNYLMFKKNMKTSYIPPEQQKFNLFRNDCKFVVDENGMKQMKSPKTEKIAAELEKINASVSDDQHQKRVEKSLKKLEKQQKKLAALNINVSLSNQIVNKPTEKLATKPTEKLATKPAEKAQKSKKNSSKTDSSWTTVTDVSSNQNDTEVKSKKRKNSNTIDDNSKKSKKKHLKDADISISCLLDKTIEECSDDDEYIPSKKDLLNEKKNKKTNKSNITLKSLVNETIDDDDDSSDEDFEPDLLAEDSPVKPEKGKNKNANKKEKIDKKLTKKQTAIAKKDNLLNQLLEKTLDEEDDESDVDFTLNDDDSSEEDNTPSVVELPKKKNKTNGKPGIKQGGIQKAKNLIATKPSKNPSSKSNKKEELKKAALAEMLLEKMSPVKKVTRNNLKKKKKH